MSDDEGKVTPFRRPRPVPDQRLHLAARRGSRPARDLAVGQNADAREAYEAAVARQREEWLLANGTVVPARITMAMDMAGLSGPQVDRDCGTYHGNPDGDIDRWEQALAVPSPEQVRLMAKVTGCPIPFFYKPVTDLPRFGPTWISWGGRRGCELVASDVIDERGVLLYEGKPREAPDTLPEPLPGMPDPQPQQPPQTSRRRPPSARRPVGEKQGVVQPPLRTGMPAHVRAELEKTLAEQAKNRP